MGTILTLIVAYVAARECLQVKVAFRPSNIADKVTNAKRMALGIIDEVRLHLMSKAQREQARVRYNARVMYDATVGEIFAKATPEEQRLLLDLFEKYSMPAGCVAAEGS